MHAHDLYDSEYFHVFFTAVLCTNILSFTNAAFGLLVAFTSLAPLSSLSCFNLPGLATENSQGRYVGTAPKQRQPLHCVSQ